MKFAVIPALFVLGWTHPASAQVSETDGYVQQIEKVAERVWVIRQPTPFHIQPVGNVTVIEQSGGLVLVDGGGSPGAGRRIVQLVRSVSSKPVAHIVITHWHGDHTLGLSAILESWPEARVIASASTRDALLGASMERYPKRAPDAAATASFLKDLDAVDRFLEQALAKPDLKPQERLGFERSRRELVAYRNDISGMYLPIRITTSTAATLPDSRAPVRLEGPLRANTKGDIAVWLPRQKVLVAGDLVVAPVPFGFDSYPSEWLGALERFRARNFAVLIPGHGAPQKDAAYLDRLSTAIQTIRAQVRPMAEQGLSLEDTRKRVDVREQRRLFAGDDPWLGRWFDRYWVEPFVEAAWKEAKGLPIEPGKG